MASPRNSTVTIDGSSFNSLSSQMGIHTLHTHDGMPTMGSLACTVSCVVDANDSENLPFLTIKKLWDLANIVTRDKVKDIKIDFWRDESQLDAVCTYTFRGWVASFQMAGGGGANHTLNLQLQPELNKNQFLDIALGN